MVGLNLKSQFYVHSLDIMPKPCNACSFENSDFMSVCEICNTSLVEAKRPMSPCPSCTFANDPLMAYCEVCGISLTVHTRLVDAARLIDEARLINEAQSAADELVALTMHLTFEDEQKFVPPADNYIRCPHCAAPIEVVILACTIFICGTTTAGQVNQHNEAAATSGVSVNTRGCGRQFQVIDGKPVPCTGK